MLKVVAAFPGKERAAVTPTFPKQRQLHDQPPGGAAFACADLLSSAAAPLRQTARTLGTIFFQFLSRAAPDPRRSLTATHVAGSAEECRGNFDRIDSNSVSRYLKLSSPEPTSDHRVGLIPCRHQLIPSNR